MKKLSVIAAICLAIILIILFTQHRPSTRQETLADKVSELESTYSQEAVALDNDTFFIPYEDGETGLLIKGFPVVSTSNTLCEIIAMLNVSVHRVSSQIVFDDVINVALDTTDTEHYAWEQGSLSATVERDGKIHLLAAGILTGDVGRQAGVANDFRDADFNVSGIMNLHVSKLHTINYTFQQSTSP